MFVGSSYNETMGDTLSDVSDRSSNYFASDMEHRNSHIQVQFSYLGGEGCILNFIVWIVKV